jgi:hypothetical protein
MLEVVIEARGLVSVRWGGKELAPLTAPEINAQLGESEYLGEFGTLNYACGGVFRNYRIMLFDREPAITPRPPP